MIVTKDSWKVEAEEVKKKGRERRYSNDSGQSTRVVILPIC